ncbi:MAG: aminotransferase class IV [Bacteroidales bacterium]|nr:aminotransferase class IV [Bacteroidales bacterium]
MKSFVNINGLIKKTNTYFPFEKNRAFYYGDGLFETIRVFKGKPLFVKYHFERLSKGLEVLGIIVEKFSDLASFEKELLKTIQNNEIIASGRLRCAVFRNEGGYYKPLTNNGSYFIEAFAISESDYKIGDGILLDICETIQKPVNFLSNLKNPHALISVLAAKSINEPYTDMILLNTYGNVCEALSSNIFIIKEGILYTPHLNQACVEGIMRQVVINNVAPALNYKVVETAINLFEIEEADEVFLTNVINGLKWVKSFRKKSYKNDKTIPIHNVLNTLISQQ